MELPNIHPDRLYYRPQLAWKKNEGMIQGPSNCTEEPGL